MHERAAREQRAVGLASAVHVRGRFPAGDLRVRAQAVSDGARHFAISAVSARTVQTEAVPADRNRCRWHLSLTHVSCTADASFDCTTSRLQER